MIRYADGSVRYFTVFEGKLLQTFAPDFHVTGAWGEGMRQIGNAVPTLLAQKIGQQLMDLLLRHDSRRGLSNVGDLANAA
jgi:DNA (cytosine-5)-methyltransferase 1